jgi:hypothetical protein
VTPEGLKAVYKDFNASGRDLVDQLRRFREHGVHVLGSFIFGLPSDRVETFDATAALAEEAELTFAQFVMMTPFPGTVDFNNWEKSMENDPTRIAGVPLTRHWLIPQNLRPKIYTPSSGAVPRRRSGLARRPFGITSIVLARSGSVLDALPRCVRVSPLCCSPNSTGRCTPIPGSQPTAPVSIEEAWQVDREALPAVVSNRTHAAIAGARQRLTSSTRSPPAQSDAI